MRKACGRSPTSSSAWWAGGAIRSLANVIELVGLTKLFGRTRAVDDLTCSVEPGMVTGFLGPNGAGKTTTMRLILGLDHPTAGTATIDGRAYRELKDPLRTVGALLDARQAHPNRSARNHLRWIAATNRIRVERVDEVLDMVGLTSVAGTNAGTLSLGMSQRLGIAAALLGDPPVLLFDEPVNGLDPEGIRWVRTLMRTLAGEGRTVFVSSHLLAEMANTADRLIVIGKGKLIASTTVADFVGRSDADTVRVRSPQLDTLRLVLTDAGLTADTDHGLALLVRGAAIEVIGDLAARNAITLHELTALQGLTAYGAAPLPPEKAATGVAVFGVPVLMILAAMTVTGEYRSGMIRTTFMATPDRTLVLAAKAVVAAAFSAAYAAVMTIAAVMVGCLMAPPLVGSQLSLVDPGTWRLVGAVALYAVLTAVLGAGVAALLRHSAGAVAVLLLWP